ncbi:hypothetical protein BDV19DRAFT_388843 [Aspergillus venezuelensis]
MSTIPSSVPGKQERDSLLLARNNLLQRIQELKGQLLAPLETRDEAILNFKPDWTQATNSGDSGSCHFLPAPYFSCGTAMCDLKKILINDLGIEIHHRVSYILVRAAAPMSRDGYNCVMMEDEVGDIALLQLFNHDEATAGDGRVEEGAMMLIKEPYLKLDIGDRTCVPVDHPTDILFLPDCDPRLLSNWRPRKEIEESADVWKTKGNEMFKDSSYYLAINCYYKTLGFRPTTDEALAIRHNRALAFLKTHQFHAALADCESNLSSTLTEKALFTALPILVRTYTDRISVGDLPDLVKRIIQKIHNNPLLATKITEVYHGSYQPLEESHVDGEPVVDADMYVVRAAQDLPANTALKFWYRSPFSNHCAVKGPELIDWGFECTCAICKDFREIPEEDLAKRQTLMDSLCNAFEPTNFDTIKIAIMLAQSENTYCQSSRIVPRLAILDKYTALSTWYFLNDQPTKGLKASLQSFKSLGYTISFSNNELKVNQWGIVHEFLVECWVSLARKSMCVWPNCPYGLQALGYAKLMYKICSGEDETFEDTYDAFAESLDGWVEGAK